MSERFDARMSTALNASPRIVRGPSENKRVDFRPEKSVEPHCTVLGFPRPHRAPGSRRDKKV